MKAKGIVKWFKNEKGFGFIVSEKKDYFVHFGNIQGDGFKTLTKGQEVEFEPSKTPKGLTATNVVVIK